MRTIDEVGVKEAVPFFGVRDLARSLAFYEKGLGFRVVARWEPDGRLRWCRIEAGGAALMLQEFAAASAPGSPTGLGVSVCFQCADALALHQLALERGLGPKEPFVGNGMWVVAFTDPDGYRIDFESVTNVPEDTTLSEWKASR